MLLTGYDGTGCGRFDVEGWLVCLYFARDTRRVEPRHFYGELRYIKSVLLLLLLLLGRPLTGKLGRRLSVI